MFGYFIFDFSACVPVFLFEMFNGFTTDPDKKLEHINSNTYKLFVTFKLFKLLMLSRISQSLYLIEDLLKNVFFLRLSLQIQIFMAYLRASFNFAILVHLFACLWIYIGFVDGQWMTDSDRELDE